jgi:hypothetical protein
MTNDGDDVWCLIERVFLKLGQMPEDIRQTWVCTELSEACLAMLDAYARGDV